MNDRAAALNVLQLGSGPTIVFVHGSTSSGESFAAQAPLADRFTLRIVDRRGFGASPEPDGRVDFDRDAVDLVELLGSDGAHLVGHSYGGVVALLVAAAAPARVRSLTVIEPPLFSAIADHPASMALRRRLEPLFPSVDDPTESAWVGRFAAGLGFPPPDAPPDALETRNIRSSMTERPIWEAVAPLVAIRDSGVPVLVVRGGWEPYPPAAEIGGAFFGAVCDRLVDELGAEAAAFPGTFHGPQASGPPFNDVLTNFVERAEAARSIGRDAG